MRADLRNRKTTLGLRASRRVKWKFYKDNFFVAIYIHPEKGAVQHGVIHRQLGWDGKGRGVWPDKTVHDLPKDRVYLYNLPVYTMEEANQLFATVLERLNAPVEMWTPRAGLGRGNVLMDTYWG